jgi:hypothetical protein
MRERIQKRRIEQIRSLARMGGISLDHYAIIGYYGRSAPLGLEVCNAVEVARRKALTKLGHRAWGDHISP